MRLSFVRRARAGPQKWTGEVEFAQGFGTQPVDYRPWRINFRIGTVF
jgi:hypothetical protein